MRATNVSSGRGSVDADRFLAMLLADDELIHAEFEAIVAAEWPTPPDEASRTCTGEARYQSGTHTTQHPIHGRKPLMPGRHERERAKERSPPLRCDRSPTLTEGR